MLQVGEFYQTAEWKEDEQTRHAGCHAFCNIHGLWENAEKVAIVWVLRRTQQFLPRRQSIFTLNTAGPMF